MEAFYRAAASIGAAVGFNILGRSSTLSTPSTEAVVAPNVDTLYGYAIYDLAVENVEITVPSISGRFFAFSFYDP